MLTFGQVENTKADTVAVKSDSVPAKPVLKNGKQIDDMISFAKTLLGTPYRYSGSSPSGFDCSGFINYVVGNFGFSLPRSSYSIAELGKTVKLSEVQPGDLLFFKGSNIKSTTVGHVAMVVEVNENEIKMIHSSNSRGVAIENFKTSKYFIARFLKAKRMEYMRE
jgi:cell wall-associated NlpC family hydrolase